MPDVKYILPTYVMDEKWTLALLIIGCTSLVFIVCLPIDFFLYLRRKRLAREHNKYKIERIAQYHAQMSDDRTVDKYVGDLKKPIETNKKRNVLGKIISLFRRKKKEEQLMPMQRPNESKSETSSKLPDMTVMPETLQTTCGSENSGENTSVAKVTTSIIVKDNDNQTKVSFKNTIGKFNENKARLPTTSVQLQEDIQEHRHVAINENVIQKINKELEELVDQENKRLNYGALQAFEDKQHKSTSHQDKKCFTNNEDLVQKLIGDDTSITLDEYTGENHDESYTDTATDNEINGRATKETEQLNHNTVHAKNKFSKSDSDFTTSKNSHSNEGSERKSEINVLKDISTDCINKRYTFSKNSKLVQSVSEQCLTSSSNVNKVHFLSRKKRNSVTPSEENLAGNPQDGSN